VIAWFVYDNGSGGLTFYSEVAPQALLDQAVRVFTSDGWKTSTHTPTHATFVRESRASCCLTLLLAFLLIVPAIVYMVLWRTTYTASVNVVSRDGVSNVGVTWNRRGVGKRIANVFYEAIDEEEGSVLVSASADVLLLSPAKFCSHCGKPVQSIQKFCGECGEQLASP
jgi:hypothetical protein